MRDVTTEQQWAIAGWINAVGFRAERDGRTWEQAVEAEMSGLDVPSWLLDGLRAASVDTDWLHHLPKGRR